MNIFVINYNTHLETKLDPKFRYHKKDKNNKNLHTRLSKYINPYLSNLIIYCRKLIKTSTLFSKTRRHLKHFSISFAKGGWWEKMEPTEAFMKLP